MSDSDDAKTEPAETYGKHSEAHAQGASVRQLLLRFLRAGQSIRLAWPTAEPTAGDSEEYPTAILPVIHNEPPAPRASTDRNRDENKRIADNQPRQSRGTSQRRLNFNYRLRRTKSLPA